jgi:predicted MFS family arabinose efflux permease
VRYALGLLFVVYTINFVDRQILAILQQPIKEELGLSDTQLGLLTGTAFGLFYATLGIPIGRLADRYSRRNVIAIAIALWSAMTALCGTARSFSQLLIFRVGVGVGEAGGSPPAISLITDYVPQERRATALGIFSLGIPAGILIGFLAGGYLREYFSWRVAFVVVGLPGLLVALLTRLTLKEPPRPSQRELPPVGEVFRFLWNRRSFRHLAFAAGLYAFAGYSGANWIPVFLERSHGMTGTDIGWASAFIVGIGSGIGTFFGGRLADSWAARDRRAYALVPAWSMALAVPLGGLAYLMTYTPVALVLLLAPGLLGQMYQAPAFAATQSLAPPSMRVITAAILFFVINIIGLACGPVVTGMLSDLYAPRFGDESLRWALVTVGVVMFSWSSVHFWLASRHLVEDFQFVASATEREQQVAP